MRNRKADVSTVPLKAGNVRLGVLLHCMASSALAWWNLAGMSRSGEDWQCMARLSLVWSCEVGQAWLRNARIGQVWRRRLRLGLAGEECLGWERFCAVVSGMDWQAGPCGVSYGSFVYGWQGEVRQARWCEVGKGTVCHGWEWQVRKHQ